MRHFRFHPGTFICASLILFCSGLTAKPFKPSLAGLEIKAKYKVFNYDLLSRLAVDLEGGVLQAQSRERTEGYLAAESFGTLPGDFATKIVTTDCQGGGIVS